MKLKSVYSRYITWEKIQDYFTQFFHYSHSGENVTRIEILSVSFIQSNLSMQGFNIKPAILIPLLKREYMVYANPLSYSSESVRRL